MRPGWPYSKRPSGKKRERKERKNLLEFLCSNTFREDYYILNDFFKQKINSIYAFVYDKSIDIVLPLSYFSLKFR